jgi:hypothetical protein
MRAGIESAVIPLEETISVWRGDAEAEREERRAMKPSF